MGGEGRVYFAAIDRYAQRYGITGQAFDEFLYLFGQLDDEWLTFRAEQMKRDEELRKARDRR